MITRLILVALIAFALPSAPQQRRELTLQEKRGKAFYLRGESASGQEITAMMGEVDVPASTLPCAGCHGLRGEGRTEGGVTAGNMSWSHLTKPYGHTDEGGRKHQAFSEATFVRTMTAGLDPAGNKLGVAMPTYRMSQEDMANLIAYLKRIDTDNDPGVTDTSIVLGTVLSPFFLSAGNFANLIAALMEVAIMALPMTLIIVAGEIDLSVESMVGLSASILGVLFAAGVPLPLTLVIVLVVGALGGLLNGVLVTRVGLPSLVVTLGTLALFRGLALVVLGSRGVSV